MMQRILFGIRLILIKTLVSFIFHHVYDITCKAISAKNVANDIPSATTSHVVLDFDHEAAFRALDGFAPGANVKVLPLTSLALHLVHFVQGQHLESSTLRVNAWFSSWVSTLVCPDGLLLGRPLRVSL